MSFSQEVKNELIKIEYERPCCLRALLYGMCLFGKSFSLSSISLQTENEKIANLYKNLIKDICNVNAIIKTSPKGRSFTVLVNEKADASKILKTFSHNGIDSLKINHSNFDCEECENAFLAGAFLSCGTISDPNKDYHLEFSVAYLNLAKSFKTLMDERELLAKTSNRKGYNIIYFKESEAIEDCLYVMGAHSATFDLMNAKIRKDIRNSANRKANCETANIERMVNAAGSQLDAIEIIRQKKGLNYLSEELKSMAILRVDNPDMSLAELAEISGLSRSGVNHRLKRLVEISKTI